MGNPFSWDSLTAVPGTDEIGNSGALAFLLIFLFGFGFAVYLYNAGSRRFFRSRLRRRMIKRGAAIAMTVFGFGLFFYGIAALQINPFSLGVRFWLWMSVLAAALMVAYFAFYIATSESITTSQTESVRGRTRAVRAAAESSSARKHSAAQPAQSSHRRPVRRRRR